MTVKVPPPPPLPDELDRLLRRLGLPYVRRAGKAQRAPRTLKWIDRAEVLCVCGPSGTGKSHFVEAPGHLAIDKGTPNRRVEQSKIDQFVDLGRELHWRPRKSRRPRWSDDARSPRTVAAEGGIRAAGGTGGWRTAGKPPWSL